MNIEKEGTRIFIWVCAFVLFDLLSLGIGVPQLFSADADILVIGAYVLLCGTILANLLGLVKLGKYIFGKFN